MGIIPWHCFRKPMGTFARSVLSHYTIFDEHPGPPMSIFTPRVRRRIHISSATYLRISDTCNKITKFSSPTTQKLYRPTGETNRIVGDKVSMVGVGQVGISAIAGLLIQGVTKHLAVVDTNEKRLNGECLDLQHAGHLLGNPKIEYSTGFDVTANSRVCVVTAGLQRKPKETRLDLAQRNADIMQKIIPELVKRSPDCVLMCACNPVDVMTYVSWKISGLPKHRVIGTGTTIDSGRFQFLLSEKLGCAPSSINALIIGEHGDSSVPVWSTVTVGGARLRDLYKDLGTEADKEGWYELHKGVVTGGYKVSAFKGYTSWAIGLCIMQVCKSIISDSNDILPVTTYVKGMHGIKEEVFLSLPCVLGSSGVYQVVSIPLNESEKGLLLKSAETVYQVQATLKL